LYKGARPVLFNMATGAFTDGVGSILPPAPGEEVPKEYVRQQLKRLGVGNVSEEELEYYAAGENIVWQVLCY